MGRLAGRVSASPPAPTARVGERLPRWEQRAVLAWRRAGRFCEARSFASIGLGNCGGLPPGAVLLPVWVRLEA